MKINKHLTCAKCGNDFVPKWASSKPRKFCGVSCANKAINAEKRVYETDVPPVKTCRACGNMFVLTKETSRKSFCGSSCSATYNNTRRTAPSKAQKIKTSISITKTLSKRDRIREPKKHTCISCKNDFIYTRKTRRKTCSDKCLHDFRVFEGYRTGRIAASFRVKRSRDEIALFTLCEATWSNVCHNEIIEGGWDADIILKDYKVCVLWNGPWHYVQLKMSNHSLLQVQTRDRIKTDVFTRAGWKVVIFEDRHFTPITAFEALRVIVNASVA